MADSNSTNTRIAKNTVVLFARMFVILLISLYTSRVVLQTLGVEDFGVFSIVGGVVVMMTFLNTSMSGATSRFLTVALTKSDKEFNDTFSTALEIHAAIALLFLIVAETLGLWFVRNKLVIPPGREFAAGIVYQCSILSAMFSMMQTPYNACVISNEKMSAYAVIEVLWAVLKLGIVFIIPCLPFDKLIVYGFLYLCISAIVFFAYRGYCKKQFDNVEFHFIRDKSIALPMLSFCGWDLYSNMADTVKQQGTNIIINLFFGVTLNAASAIATQVQSAVGGFAGSVIQAFRPPIIKSYSSCEIKKMEALICKALKYSMILFGAMLVPLYLKMDYVLGLWLGTVPEHAAEFCKLLLFCSYVSLASMILITSIHATGRIGNMSAWSGTLSLLTLPLIYVAYKFIGTIPVYAYFIMLGINLLKLVMFFIITRANIPDINYWKLGAAILLPSILILACGFPARLCTGILPGTFANLCIVTGASIVFLGIMTYLLLLDKEDRLVVNRKAKQIMHINA